MAKSPLSRVPVGRDNYGIPARAARVEGGVWGTKEGCLTLEGRRGDTEGEKGLRGYLEVDQTQASLQCGTKSERAELTALPLAVARLLPDDLVVPRPL